MSKVHKQVPALAALVDWWWPHLRREIEGIALAPLWQQWMLECFLPVVYWGYQLAHTRCPRRKGHLRQALERSTLVLHRHPLTSQVETQTLARWRAWALQPRPTRAA